MYCQENCGGQQYIYFKSLIDAFLPSFHWASKQSCHTTYNPSLASPLFRAHFKIFKVEDPQSKQLRLQKEIMHKPHNRISHWLNVLWKKTAQLNHVYPSVFPLHTQSHSSWCSKGTSVNDLCNPRTPILGFSWRTWRRRRQASRKQQVLHHTHLDYELDCTGNPLDDRKQIKTEFLH